MAETWNSECATVLEQKHKTSLMTTERFTFKWGPKMAYIKPETYFCLHKTNTFCFTEDFINYSTFS